MVQYKHIIQAIEEDINKSHQHLLIPKTVEKTFDKFHEETCGEHISKKEHYIASNNQGDIQTILHGDEDSVPINWMGACQHYDETGEPLHDTHNHPRNGQKVCAECLSSKDIDNLFLKYDGSEFFDEPLYDEPVYPFKSTSCESANGTRMTLVRGDKFNPKNEKKAHKLGVKLEKYWSDYYDEYYSYANKIASKTTIDEWKKIMKDDTLTYEEYNKYIHAQTIKKVGVFEQNKEFKDIQKEFRSLDCRLSYKHIKE